MRHTSWILVLVVLITGCASPEVRRLLDSARSPNSPVGRVAGAVPLTQAEAASGLREALMAGAARASDLLSKKDAYLASALRIPFPPEAEKVKQALTDIGLETLVEDVVTTVNHAAEDAATQAKPIFVEAIKAMTITDAIRIVQGSKTSATEYLKEKTRTKLVAAYRPSVSSSLDKVNATKYWSQVMGAYNKIPFADKVNADLPAYVTEKAIDGLFTKVAEEESLIRVDPAARATELLKRVFGSAEAQGAK